MFPTLNIETSDGKGFTFPRDLLNNASELTTWVIVGFSRDSQKATEACGKTLGQTYKELGFSIAIMEGIPFFAKALAKKHILSTLPEAQKARFFFLYDGTDTLKKAAGFDEKFPNDAYIVGLKAVPSGGKPNLEGYELVFKSHGSCDPAHVAALKKKIDGLLAAVAPSAPQRKK